MKKRICLLLLVLLVFPLLSQAAPMTIDPATATSDEVLAFIKQLSSEFQKYQDSTQSDTPSEKRVDFPEPVIGDFGGFHVEVLGYELWTNGVEKKAELAASGSACITVYIIFTHAKDTTNSFGSLLFTSAYQGEDHLLSIKTPEDSDLIYTGFVPKNTKQEVSLSFRLKHADVPISFSIGGMYDDVTFSTTIDITS